MKKAFSFGGDLRSLRIPVAVDDPRSVTFGRNHDTIRELNDQAINPYNEPSDAFLATAYVLARQRGTPLILNWDNYDVPYIQYGVKFRQIMQQRGSTGGNVTENVLAVIDDPTVLLMERGVFLSSTRQRGSLINKGSGGYDTDELGGLLSRTPKRLYGGDTKKRSREEISYSLGDMESRRD
jgi:alpha-amylase